MNRNIFIWNGLCLLIVGFWITHNQTKAWGGHYLPQSTTEAICDLICVIWILVGVIFMTIGNALPKQPKQTKK